MEVKLVLGMVALVALLNQATAFKSLFPSISCAKCCAPTCNSAPAPSSVCQPPIVNQKPDVTLPLHLPSKIPIGNFCSCQKYVIKPSLVAASVPSCAPVPTHAYAPASSWTPAPQPVNAPACAPPCAHTPSAPATAGLSPATMALLGFLPGLYPQAAAPAPSCPCA